MLFTLALLSVHVPTSIYNEEWLSFLTNNQILQSLLSSSRNTIFSSAPFHPIYEKLTDSNFPLWWQQVDQVIKVHKLQCFVANPIILM